MSDEKIQKYIVDSGITKIDQLNSVDTKVLKQIVIRNIIRFPSDFLFELTKKGFEDWRSQFVTSNTEKGR